MRATRLILGWLVAVGTALAVIMFSAGAQARQLHRRSTPSEQSGSGGFAATLAHNRAAARTDARALAADVELPAGASRLPGPRHAPQGLVATTAGAVAETRWVLPHVSPQQVMAYATVHRPADASSGGSESAYGRAGLVSLTAISVLANLPGETALRQVDVTAAVRRAGGSAVTVEAESVWEIPRTSASIIRAGTVRRVDLVARTSSGRRLSSRSLTDPPMVGAVVRFFNGLEADQPFTLSCPAQVAGQGEDEITVSFLGSSRATASYEVGFDGSADGCNAITLTVRGHRVNGLLAPDYVSDLDRLFRVRLPRH